MFFIGLNSLYSMFSGEPFPYEPFFRGPVSKRSCTDIICCMAFVAAIVSYMLIGILALLYGDPRHVLLPRNSTGMFCGSGVNFDKPNVLYFDVLKCARATTEMDATLEGLQCPTTQVCVKKCPSEFWKLPPEAYAPDALPKDFFQQQYCDPRLDLAQTTMSVQDILNQELCPYFYTPSKPALGKCLPSFELQDVPPDFSLPGFASVDETVKHIKSAMDSLVSGFNFKSVGLRIFEDFATSWYWILIGLVVAMVVSLMFLLLMRYLMFVLLLALIVGVLVAAAYGIYYCYREYNHYRHSKLTLGDITYNSEFSVYLQVKETWLFFCKGYQIFSQDMYLATSGAPVYHVAALNSSIANCSSITGSEICIPKEFSASLHPDCPSVRCVFFKYDDTDLFSRIAPYLQIYNLLAFLWCVNFIIALGQCTLAGTFASFYWAFSKPADIPPYPLLQAFIRTLGCHVGSLALGAVILTIFQVPRMLLEYLDHRFRDCRNFCCQFVMMSLKCCFWFLDKFLKFFHRNTYIMIAIHGNNFHVSGKNAYMLLRRNINRVVVLDCVTDTLLFSGKVLVVGLVGLLAFFFFSGRIRLPDDNFQIQLLHYYWLPVITVMAGAYLIAQGFFSVYSMCVDTLFLCFLEDLERNEGTMLRPYYMSGSLWRILNKS
uniref:Choline transporter-like protein n=1 Tax=Electrophorus electricus TaxID=8005 RepID=A0AAY5EIL2_ELEEL